MAHKVVITDKAALIDSLKMSGSKAHAQFTNGSTVKFTVTVHDHDEKKSLDLATAKYFIKASFEEANGETYLDMDRTVYCRDRVYSVHVHPNYL
ncbi:hypothetical protein BGZ96_003760 [Linnemannia gamsii]|uniref:Uncharacterized protein n=1 Tax=Linnemannia gamsii TaxID=64522 RepID=A0ABQ7K9E5_9FUNG|nr:hypothetical protein BGZ96_003760 [Linnemannia gamsii]